MKLEYSQWPKNGAVLLVGDLSNRYKSSSPVKGEKVVEGRMRTSEEVFPQLLGAFEIALQTAHAMLCENSARSESLLTSHSHPDFRIIQPEQKSQWIKIDQIRDLITWASGKPQISDKKIALIAPAHALNLQAANALLKTLEESPLDTLFILVTDKPSFLPATIRSRCYWIRLKIENKTNLSAEFKMGLLKDLQDLQKGQIDPVIVSERWIKQDPKQILEGLMVVLNEQLTTQALHGNIIKNTRWWAFIDSLIKARRTLEEPNQPNLQLLMDSLLIQYCQN
jgi:hypothetical protein